MSDAPLLDLRRVVCFIVAADTFSFQRAAERLAVDARWISAQVRGLEELLGVQLLERRGGSLLLTPAGHRLRAHCDDLMAANASLLAGLAANRRSADHRLVLAGPASTARSGVRAELVGQLLAAAPELNVDIIEHSSGEVLARLRRGWVDAGLVRSPFDRTGLRVLPLRVARHTLLMPRNHPLAELHEVTIDVLDGFPVAAFDAARNPALFEQFLGPLRDAGAELVLVPELHPAAYAAAVYGDGVLAVDVDGLILSAALEHERSALIARPLMGLEGIADTYLVARRQRDHPAIDLLWRLARDLAATGGAR
jgi:LysR family transcriptional regulator, benzoate and cis,cis-muconate-responsive activator of ben and cat genes